MAKGFGGRDPRQDLQPDGSIGGVRTAQEWVDIFFTAHNPERDIVEGLDNDVVRLNLHTKAVLHYLKVKQRKGLVKGDIRPLLDWNIREGEHIRPLPI